MEFIAVSSAYLDFENDGHNLDGTMAIKTATIQVDNLEDARPATSSSSTGNSYFLTKLEDALLMQGSRPGKRQRLSQPIDCRLKVQLFYGAISAAAPNRKQTGFFKISDFDEEANGLINRLVDVCGGRQNIRADLHLEFGRKGPEEPIFTLDYEDLRMLIYAGNFSVFASYFDFPKSLAENWSPQLTGELSLTLKLNGKALSLIHGESVGMRDLITWKMLGDAEESGDGIIVLGGGTEIRCHQVILSAHSEVFKEMFKSNMKEGESSRVTMTDISEGGVNALLAYLYCSDIREAVNTSYIAVELLKTADTYAIDNLFQIMKELILGMGDDWFSMSAAVKLRKWAKSKANSPDFKDFKELGEKAKLFLKF